MSKLERLKSVKDSMDFDAAYSEPSDYSMINVDDYRFIFDGDSEISGFVVFTYL